MLTRSGETWEDTGLVVAMKSGDDGMFEGDIGAKLPYVIPGTGAWRTPVSSGDGGMPTASDMAREGVEDMVAVETEEDDVLADA